MLRVLIVCVNHGAPFTDNIALILPNLTTVRIVADLLSLVCFGLSGENTFWEQGAGSNESSRTGRAGPLAVYSSNLRGRAPGESVRIGPPAGSMGPATWWG